MMTLMFKDTGAGMTKENMASVRDRNMEEDSGDYSVLIQLIICQQLAALMGGQMEFESELGKGSTIWISFPCKIVDMPKQEEPAATPDSTPIIDNNLLANSDLIANSDMLANMSEEEINNLLANSDLFK